MQVFIKGISTQKYSTIQTINDIKKTDSLRILYVILNNMFNLTTKHYYLYQNTKILPVTDDKTLEDYNIMKDTTIYIHFRLGNAGPVIIKNTQ